MGFLFFLATFSGLLHNGKRKLFVWIMLLCLELLAGLPVRSEEGYKDIYNNKKKSCCEFAVKLNNSLSSTKSSVWRRRKKKQSGQLKGPLCVFLQRNTTYGALKAADSRIHNLSVTVIVTILLYKEGYLYFTVRFYICGTKLFSSNIVKSWKWLTVTHW